MIRISEILKSGFRLPEIHIHPVTRWLMVLVSVLALSGCGVGESNQEPKLKSRYCQIPTSDEGRLNTQTDENGIYLIVMVDSSSDQPELIPGKVYIEASAQKLQQLRELNLSEDSLKDQFPLATNIGFECEYYKEDGKPILKRVTADTYKNGAKLNLGEVWSK